MDNNDRDRWETKFYCINTAELKIVKDVCQKGRHVVFRKDDVDGHVFYKKIIHFSYKHLYCFHATSHIIIYLYIPKYI